MFFLYYFLSHRMTCFGQATSSKRSLWNNTSSNRCAASPVHLVKLRYTVVLSISKLLQIRERWMRFLNLEFFFGVGVVYRVEGVGLVWINMMICGQYAAVKPWSVLIYCYHLTYQRYDMGHLFYILTPDGNQHKNYIKQL